MFAPGGVTLPSDEYLQRLKHPLDNVPYILFLGRVVKEKRCDILLNVYQNIQNQINTHLVIAGPIEDEAIVSQYRKNKRIHFIGSIFDDKKDAFLKHSLVYVIPSDLEGLSISLLEAMSFGCLCIASDIQANREALAETGLYFRAGDVADLTEILYKSIIKNKEYDLLRTNAQKRIRENFDWKTLTNELALFYNSILKK
jgi:glycosyltransferase involved in cell wall biosynthesis